MTGLTLLLAMASATPALALQDSATTPPATGSFSIENLGKPRPESDTRPRPQGPVDPDAPAPRRPSAQPTPAPSASAPTRTPSANGNTIAQQPRITIDPPTTRSATTQSPAQRRAAATERAAAPTAIARSPTATDAAAQPVETAAAASERPASPAIDAPIQRRGGGNGGVPWAWLLAFAALVGGGAYLYFARGRGGGWQPAVGLPLAEAPRAKRVAPPPAKPPAPRATANDAADAPDIAAALALPAAQALAGLEIRFIPDYAAATMTRVALRYALSITNTGDAPVEALVVRGAMISAQAGQDAEIAAFMADPSSGIAHRVAQLAPGETIELEGDLGLPLDEARGVRYGQRLLFVPLASLALDFVRAGAAAHVPLAYLVGVDAEGAEKMGPLRLDLGPKTYNHIGQRPLAYASAA